MSDRKISALTMFAVMLNGLAEQLGKDDVHTRAMLTAYKDLVSLIEWSEHALDCISASKHPNTHARLRDAIERVKDDVA